MDATSFARYALSSTERVLRFDGEIVPLPPKAIDLLELLLLHANDVVSKDDLIEALWPAGPVEEGNLTQSVFRLRRVFETRDPSVKIETIPRRGYRLVVPRLPLAAPATTGRSSRRYAALGFVAVTTVVLLAFSAPRRGSDAILVQRGYSTWSNARSTSDVERSVAYFRQALQVSPESAPAHAGLAYAYLSLAMREMRETDVAVDVRVAREEAQRAIDVDASNAEAYAALGQADANFGNADVAGAEFTRAVQLDPSSVEANTWYGELLFSQGRLNAAKARFEAAQSQNSTWTTAGDDLALLAYLRRDYARAHAYAAQSLMLAPSDRFARYVLALVEAVGNPAGSARDLRTLIAAHAADAVDAYALLAYVLDREGETGQSRAAWHEVERLVGRQGIVSDPLTLISLAGILAPRDRTEAFAWLGRLRVPLRTTYADDPRLDGLRRDARFARWAKGG